MRSAQTNIVFVDVADGRGPALLEFLGQNGVLATGLIGLRFVTHLDVDAAGIDHALSTIRRFFAEAARGPIGCCARGRRGVLSPSAAMPDTAHLLVFIAAGWLLNLTPGPDVLYIVNTALKGGRASGHRGGAGHRERLFCPCVRGGLRGGRAAGHVDHGVHRAQVGGAPRTWSGWA